MANPQRAAQLTKAHKVLKSHFKPVAADPKRPLLETLLFAALLENNTFEKAEDALALLADRYFDWNEVRVSTITELTETLTMLHDPAGRAATLKKILQGIFEAKYSFDIEPVRKQNLGVAIKELEKLTQSGQFVIAYAVQNALGGHAVALDRGAWELLIIGGIATAEEAHAGELSGLERTIPKTKGSEFFSILHQAGAEFLQNPQSPVIKKMMASLNPNAVFPKKGDTALRLPEATIRANNAKAAEKAADDKAAAEKALLDKKGPQKLDPKSAAGKAAAAKEAKAANGKPKEPAKPEAKDKKSAEKQTEKQPEKSAAKPAKADVKKLPTKSKPTAAVVKKSPTKQLAKRKPR